MPRMDFPRRWIGLILALVAAGAWVGCVSDHPDRDPRPLADAGNGPIDELNLLAIPVALNLDQVPGVDGFVIKVYASSRRNPKPVPIVAGSLDVLMYDGVPGITHPVPPEPRHTWHYSAPELKAFEIQTSIGTGYQLAPLWGDDKPVQNKISVLVRYTAPQGQPLTSAPSVISVAIK